MSEKDNNTNVQKETDKLFDLKVLEVKNTLPEIKLPRPVDPRLPTIPGLVLFVARCRSGKSNFIMNYLFSENYLGGKVNVFDVIYYVSPTCRMDKSTQVLFREDLEDKVIVFEDIDNVDAFIQNILDYQESFPVNDEDNPRPLVCIVLDDISGALKRSSATTHLCSRYRHYNIHLIISNQTLRDLPTVCRSMADSVFLAQTTSVMERQKVMEEYGDLYKNKKKLQIKDFYILIFNHELGKEYFLLYKNFANRSLAQDYCFNFINLQQKCIILNAQNLD